MNQTHTPNALRTTKMLILLALAIVMFALAFPPWREYRNVSQADVDVETLAIAIKKYFRHTQQYPENLEQLVTDPGVEGWRGTYLASVPKTPWGGTYVLLPNAYKVGIVKGHPRVPSKYQLGGIAEISRVYHVDARLGEKYWW